MELEVQNETEAPELEAANPESVAEGQEVESDRYEGIEDLDAEALEGSEAEGETQAEEDGGEELEGDDEQSEVDTEYALIERDGKQYQIPKELENDFLMHRDYTQKTQLLAEEKRQNLEIRERLQQLQTVSEERLEKAAEWNGLQQQLEQYAKVDWQQLEREDPMSAQSHWRQYQLLKDKAQNTQGELQQLNQRDEALQQQQAERRMQATKEFAVNNIPNWSPERYQQILSFAQEINVDPNLVHSKIDPVLLKVLDLAEVGHRARSQAKQAKPKRAPVKPTQKVAAKASPPQPRDLGSMSMEAYAEARKKGIGGASPF